MNPKPNGPKVADLMKAIAARDVESVANALKEGASPRARAWRKAIVPGEPTPLLLAVKLGDRPIVELLLDAGAPIEEDTRSWNSPLAVACHTGDIEMVKLLLSRGADINYARPGHSTPLEEAAFYTRGDLVALLLERGARPDSVLALGPGSLGRIQPAILRQLAAKADAVPADVRKLLEG
jgi:ankyrin repeat protein